MSAYLRKKITSYLEEWIDGTRICSDQSDPPNELMARSRLTLDLLEQIITLLSSSIPILSNEPAAIPLEDITSLKSVLSDLYLWGDSFPDGLLDCVLDDYPDMKKTVLESLMQIGISVMTNVLPFCEKLSTTLLAGPPSPRQRKIKIDEKKLEYLLELSKIISDNDSNSYPDSDYCEGMLEESGTLGTLEENFHVEITTLKTYVTCLMDLLPTLLDTLNYERIKSSRLDLALQCPPFQVSGPAQSYVSLVRDLFVTADNRLIERLGEANWQRHVALRKRLNALEEDGDTVPVAGLLETVFQPVSIFHDSGLATSFPTDSHRALTVISSSTFKSTTSEESHGGFRVPPVPEEVSLGLPFLCTICGHMLTEIKNRSDWKRHVFFDIKPYLCVHSDCRDSFTIFPTRKLWEVHEFSHHRNERSWTCTICFETFANKDKCRTHISEAHPSNTVHELLEQYTLQPAAKLECPLCRTVPGKSRSHYVNHICRHLENIALAALPGHVAAHTDDEESITGQHSDQGALSAVYESVFIEEHSQNQGGGKTGAEREESNKISSSDVINIYQELEKPNLVQVKVGNNRWDTMKCEHSSESEFNEITVETLKARSRLDRCYGEWIFVTWRFNSVQRTTFFKVVTRDSLVRADIKLGKCWLEQQLSPDQRRIVSSTLLSVPSQVRSSSFEWRHTTISDLTPSVLAIGHTTASDPKPNGLVTGPKSPRLPAKRRGPLSSEGAKEASEMRKAKACCAHLKLFASLVNRELDLV
ncbi:hypothetical protein B0O99DRAFT_694475 [Bisporella sp. PMI_857]|nr:hypothetical protein B0O99DRAFT_694475 [Bisporella sp. PMI_857]